MHRYLDVADDESWAQFAAELSGAKHRVRALVNNVGTLRHSSIADASID